MFNDKNTLFGEDILKQIKLLRIYNIRDVHVNTQLFNWMLAFLFFVMIVYTLLSLYMLM